MASSEKEYWLGVDELNHMRYMFKRLDCMRQKQKNCDLVISVSGQEIHTNKNIMCAASDYFDAMFSHNMRENQRGVVEMKGVTFAAVKKCVDFIYTGQIFIADEHCEELLYCADLLQLKDVYERFSPFLESRLNLKSFFQTRRIAGKFSLLTLIEICDEFAILNFVKLSKEEKFAELEFDYIHYLLSSSRESSSSINEDSKLAATLQWVNFNPKMREVHLMALVNLLNMANISREYCRFLAEKEHLCQKSGELMTKIVLALTTPCDVTVSDTKSSNIISSSSKANSLVMWDMSDKCLQLYTPSKQKLHRFVAHSAVFETKFTACTLNDKLYLLTSDKKVFVLGHEWDRLDDMLCSHGDHLQCAAHEKEVYVGGENSMEKLSVVPNNERWQSINLHQNLCDKSCLVCYHDFIFMIGGYNHGESLKKVLKYSPKSCSWSATPSLNTGRYNASATVYDDRLYVGGGVSNSIKTRTFEMFDITTNSWTQLARMNTRRSSFRIHVVDDKIFAVGSGIAECSIEIYDTKANSWYHHDCRLMANIMGVATLSLYNEDG